MMCQWGTETLLNVPVHPDDSCTGKFRWALKGVDSCIADIVQALNDANIHTRSSCCGHGKSAGHILLHDGRELIIKLKREANCMFENIGPAAREAIEKHVPSLRKIAGVTARMNQIDEEMVFEDICEAINQADVTLLHKYDIATFIKPGDYQGRTDDLTKTLILADLLNWWKLVSE